MLKAILAVLCVIAIAVCYGVYVTCKILGNLEFEIGDDDNVE
jgi:hypothetical protein